MEIVLALYISAAREVRKQYPEMKVTAESVRVHMANRCKEQPLVLMIMMWVRYMDVAFMMQEAGRGEPGSFGDHALYLAASRIANPLRAVCNAYNYLHTTTLGAREYQLASDQIRLLIDKFVTFGSTRTGKPLVSDLLVEKAVGDVRAEFGKHATRSIVAGKLEAISGHIPARNQARTAGGASSSLPAAESSLTRTSCSYVLSNVAVHTLKFCARHSIWELGKPLRTDKGADISKGFYTLDGKELNPLLLSAESLGTERYSSFVRKNWLQPSSIPATIELATTRFEAIIPMQADVKAVAEWRHRALTTTDAAQLTQEQRRPWKPGEPPKHLMTNEAMTDEIKAHRANAGEDATLSSVESKGKASLAAALVYERLKPTAIRVPSLVVKAGPSEAEQQAACRAPLVSTQVFFSAAPGAPSREGFTFRDDGALGSGYYLRSIEGRSWFVAPPLSPPSPVETETTGGGGGSSAGASRSTGGPRDMGRTASAGFVFASMSRGGKGKGKGARL
jgi:hypothetical protein